MISGRTRYKTRMVMALIVLVALCATTAMADVNDDLINAVRHDDLSAVNDCIDKGADVNVKDVDGATPLILVFDSMINTNSVRFKINMNSNAVGTAHLENSNSTMEKPKNTKEIARLLIANGADVNARMNNGFSSPVLWVASFFGHKDLVEMLLAKGADVNAKSNVGDTALMAACNIDVARLLLSKGANVNTKDYVGDTALIRASSLCHNKDVVELLIAKGANVNARNNDHKTALMEASTPEVKQLLIRAGAK